MKARSRTSESGGGQLRLPLDQEASPDREDTPQSTAGPPEKTRPQRKSGGGFVPVTRDPAVAKSYSDNIAFDYAIARGLAEALSSLPPEELAALRAKVAQAARQTGRAATRHPHH